ncbi:MAG: hypothetical protein J0L62_01930 [Bacteroidetes bacterium]|nr:hypothetical protein [Bacteroidota bacterium]
MNTLNGSAVCLNSVVILIMGASASGKSSLAYNLIKRGGFWLGDGQIFFGDETPKPLLYPNDSGDFLSIRYPTLFQELVPPNFQSEIRSSDSQLIISVNLSRVFPLQKRTKSPLSPDMIIWTEKSTQVHSSLYPVQVSELRSLISKSNLNLPDRGISGWKFISGSGFENREQIIAKLEKLTAELGFNRKIQTGVQ